MNFFVQIGDMKTLRDDLGAEDEDLETLFTALESDLG